MYSVHTEYCAARAVYTCGVNETLEPSSTLSRRKTKASREIYNARALVERARIEGCVSSVLYSRIFYLIRRIKTRIDIYIV